MEKVAQLATLKVEPLDAGKGLRRLACTAIKRAITEMNIYDHPEEIRLDERQLSRDLGVSRTPIREALSLLEQEGFVRSVPRRGIYIVRKNKREIIEMITVWAAIESMAARLVCELASAEDLAELRDIAEFKHLNPATHVDEYAQSNMLFHRTIIRLSGCALMAEIVDSLFIHMRAVRSVTMRQGDRAQSVDRRSYEHRDRAGKPRSGTCGAVHPRAHAGPCRAYREIRRFPGSVPERRGEDALLWLTALKGRQAGGARPEMRALR